MHAISMTIDKGAIAYQVKLIYFLQCPYILQNAIYSEMLQHFINLGINLPIVPSEGHSTCEAYLVGPKSCDGR